METTRITNSPAELRLVIARAGKRPRVVLEATYGWYWAADTLAAAGAEVHLAHPLGVKAFSYRRVKNDERDAADLADLLRMGGCRRHGSPRREIRALRELVRGTGSSWSGCAPRARTRCTRCWPSAASRYGSRTSSVRAAGMWLDGLVLRQPYAGKVASLRTLASAGR